MVQQLPNKLKSDERNKVPTARALTLRLLSLQQKPQNRRKKFFPNKLQNRLCLAKATLFVLCLKPKLTHTVIKTHGIGAGTRSARVQEFRRIDDVSERFVS
jgi:hypothetical protein